FTVTRLARSDADFVWEQQLDLPALVDVARALGAEGIGPSPSAIDDALAQDPLGLGVTLGEVVAGLDTTIGVIATIDDARILRIPGDSTWFPFTEFLFQIDGMGKVADALARRAAFDPFIQAEESAQWLTIRPAIRLPPPWNAYRPALYKDVATGRVYLVSTPEYLEKCLADGTSVVESDDYRQAFDGLPRVGNGMMFMSRQLTRELHGILDRRINEEGASVGTAIARFVLPSAGSPVGWAAVSRNDGWLFTSNSPSSHKATFVSLGYAALLPAILVLGASGSTPRASTPPELPF
ncbi:MAG: hypothetical protein WBG86_14950, partial [Polyangiales bacterium]